MCIRDSGDIVHLEAITLKRYRADGTVVWSTSGGSQTDPAVGPNGDVALGGVRTNEPHGSTDVTYYNSNGTIRWQKTSSKGTRTQVCFGPDGTLYTTTSGTTAFNPDGTVKWTGVNGGWGVSLDGLGRALVPQSNKVFAYDRLNGALLWSATLPFAGSIVEGLSIDLSNRVYVTSTDGYIACLRPDGTLAWNLKVCDQFYTQPSISTGATAVATGRVGYDTMSVYRVK